MLEEFDKIVNWNLIINLHLNVVAKVLINKQVYSDAFRAVMKNMWRVHNGTRIEIAKDNIFLIQFKSTMEKAIVLAEGTFDRSLIIINSPKDQHTIGSIVFNEETLWVYIMLVSSV